MQGQPRLNALMYHDIVTEGACTRYGFTLAEFRGHLDSIARRVEGVPAVVRPGGDLSGFALTFDDGYRGWLAAGEELAGRGWSAIFFLITGTLGLPGKLAPRDVRRLAAMGHVIGTHSVDHCARFEERDEAYLRRQWRESKAALESILGREVLCASIPGGGYGPRVASAASEAGLDYLFTSEPVTRAWRVGGCRLFGRFSLERGVSRATVARLAAGARPEAAARYLAWNAKKAVKRALRL